MQRHNLLPLSWFEGGGGGGGDGFVCHYNCKWELLTICSANKTTWMWLNRNITLKDQKYIQLHDRRATQSQHRNTFTTANAF